MWTLVIVLCLTGDPCDMWRCFKFNFKLHGQCFYRITAYALLDVIALWNGLYIDYFRWAKKLLFLPSFSAVYTICDFYHNFTRNIYIYFVHFYIRRVKNRTFVDIIRCLVCLFLLLCVTFICTWVFSFTSYFKFFTFQKKQLSLLRTFSNITVLCMRWLQGSKLLTN